MSTDQTIVITGGTGGIGFQSALGLARTGARVIITGRDATRGEQALTTISAEVQDANVDLVLGDLSARAGVSQLATGLLNACDRIDVLVNNAGYLGAEPATNADGLEMHFAVNVAAPYQLTQALLPALTNADKARVLMVSGGAKPAKVDIDNLQAEKGFKGLETYTHSKSVMEAMSVALAKQLEPQGIFLNVVFPGRASTAMTQALTSSHLRGPLKILYPLFKFMFRDDDGKSAANAARSTIWVATARMLDGISGSYFDANSNERRLHPSAYDQAVQGRIIDLIPEQR